MTQALDEILLRHKQIISKISDVLADKVFSGQVYPEEGSEGILKHATSDDLAPYFGLTPDVARSVSDRLSVRVGWYLDQIESLRDIAAFLPLDDAPVQLNIEHPSASTVTTVLDLILDRETQSHLFETTHHFRPRGWDLLSLDTSDVLCASTGELKARARLDIFDSTLFGYCRFVLRKLNDDYINSPSSGDARASIERALKQTCDKLSEHVLSCLASRQYVFASSLNWAAVMIKLSPGSQDLPTCKTALSSVCTALYGPAGLLKNLASRLTQSTATAVDGLRGQAQITVGDVSRGCVDLLDDDRFVVLHTLLNSCTLLTNSRWDGGDHSLDATLAGNDWRDTLRTLTRLVYHYVARPAIERDLYWLALRLRVLNEFLGKLLSDAVAAEMGDGVVHFVQELFVEEQRSGAYGKAFRVVTDNPYCWPTRRRLDTQFRHAFKSLYDLIQAAHARTSWSGSLQRPRPINVLIASEPGSGKTFLIQSLRGADDKGILFEGLDCSQYRDWQELTKALTPAITRLATQADTLLLFLDEIDALEKDDIYSQLLSLMWEGKIADTTVVPDKKQLVLFCAASRYSTCREFRLALRKPHVKKGRDFVSRLVGEIDIPGVGGTDAYASRTLMAYKELVKRYGQLTFDDGLRQVLVAAGLNVALGSGRAVEKWVGRVRGPGRRPARSGRPAVRLDLLGPAAPAALCEASKRLLECAK